MLILDFNSEALYSAAFSRTSVRNYKKEPLSKEDYGYIKEKVDYVNSLNMGIEVYLIHQSGEDVFTGILGSYGKINNAPSYLMLVGETEKENIEAIIGFLGEYLVLECKTRAVGSCWVAGTFKKSNLPKEVIIKDNEKLYSLIALGYNQDSEERAKKAADSRKRKPLSKIVTNFEELSKSPGPIQKAIELAQIAPSAINLQPWKFKVSSKSIEVFIDQGLLPIERLKNLKKIDLGIATFHIIAALRCFNEEPSLSFGGRESFGKITI